MRLTAVLLVVFDVFAPDGEDEQTERNRVRRRERFITGKEHEGPYDGEQFPRGRDRHGRYGAEMFHDDGV